MRHGISRPRRRFEALPLKRRRDEGFASASWIDKN
jgi:hypothetical protein